MRSRRRACAARSRSWSAARRSTRDMRGRSAPTVMAQPRPTPSRSPAGKSGWRIEMNSALAPRSYSQLAVKRAKPPSTSSSAASGPASWRSPGKRYLGWKRIEDDLGNLPDKWEDLVTNLDSQYGGLYDKESYGLS